MQVVGTIVFVVDDDDDDGKRVDGQVYPISIPHVSQAAPHFSRSASCRDLLKCAESEHQLSCQSTRYVWP